ncbi:MAG TPA: TIGR04211 family SH3 domain-containing protein [Solimonas sp.]|nr:TIGR04211 family SH3 domain-containing protein [Solimonas sp.]
MRRRWLAALLLRAGLAWAEPHYVSDQLAVTLRKDKGPEAPVLGLVDSGTEVELLEADEPSGYVRVRIGRTREGWMLARYLSSEPAARVRLSAMQRQVAEKAKKLDQVQGELELLRDENARLTVERDEARQQLRATSRRLVPGSALTAEEMEAEAQAAPHARAAPAADIATLNRSIQDLQARLAAASAPRPSDSLLVGVLALAMGLAGGLWLALRRRRPSPRNWRDF